MNATDTLAALRNNHANPNSWQNEYTSTIHEGVSEDALRDYTRHERNTPHWPALLAEVTS